MGGFSRKLSGLFRNFVAKRVVFPRVSHCPPQKVGGPPGEAPLDLRLALLGAGPIGLRAALELALLGAQAQRERPMRASPLK